MSREMKDSGIDWIGEIPSNWDIKPIKRNYKIISGATPKSNNEENWGGDITWITPADFKASGKYIATGRKNITEKGYNSCSTTIVPKNSIIFTKRAPVGTVAINSNELCTNQGCLSCVPFKEMNSSFGYYSMLAGKCIFEISAQGTTFMEISANDFANIKLPIAPLEEQEEIAKFLDVKCESIDQAIQKQKDIVDKLMEYKQSVITQAVTKGLNPSVEMKNTPISGLTQIPKTWNIVPLKTLFSFSKGLSITKSDLTDEGIKVISYGQIHSKKCDGVHATNELIRFTAEKFKSNNSLAKCGSFIFADTSEDLEGCGNAIYITNEVYGGYHTVILNPKETHDYRYLAYLFKTDAWRTELRKQLTEVKVFSITQSALKNMHVILPSYEEMVQIADFLDSKCLKINKSIERSNKIIQKLEEYKKVLIYNAVTGKIDCRNA